MSILFVAYSTFKQTQAHLHSTSPKYMKSLKEFLVVLNVEGKNHSDIVVIKMCS